MTLNGVPYGNVWEKAVWVPLLKENGILVLNDIDNTLTSGHGVPTGRDLVGRRAVRELIQKRGAVGGVITARTLGMTLSSGKLRQSQQNKGFNEPEPRLGKDPESGRHIFVPPEKDPYYDDCLDWGLAGAFGSGVMVEHDDGYAIDPVYDHLVRFDWVNPRRPREIFEFVQGLEEWREVGLLLLKSICERPDSLILEKDLKTFMAPIESGLGYIEGRNNVAPIKARIQMHFAGTAGLAAMHWLMAQIDIERSRCNPWALRLEYVDESKINWEHPEQSQYVLYLVPKKARKENLLNWMLREGAGGAGIDPQSMHLFYAGDAFTDFRAGIYGGGTTPTHFLLVPGSPLAPFIRERRPYYGFEDLNKLLWKNGHRTEDRLRQIPGRPGHYTFHVSNKVPSSNTVIDGGVVYEGLTPPEAVAQFLEDFVPKLKKRTKRKAETPA